MGWCNANTIEAYPKKEFVSVSRDFMGPVEMYNKCGFVEIAIIDDMAIMRKTLGDLL